MGIKGIIFTFDALLGSLILLGAILVMFHSTGQSDPSSAPTQYAADVIAALSAIQVKEINDTWVQTLITNETIDNPSRSVLDQIGQFWAIGNTVYAENLSRIVAEQLLPVNTGFSLTLGSDTIYQENSTKPERLRSASRRMITGIEKGAQLSGSTGVAYLTGIGAKETSAFAFFGGFVGQGNITVQLRNLPADIVNTSNVVDFFIQGEFDDEFTLELNGISCGGTFTGPYDEAAHFNLSSCAGDLVAGNNTIQLFFEELLNASVSGGFVKLKYSTTEFQEPLVLGEKYQFFPQVEGVINLYDSFYVPGTLTNLSLYLHYWVDENNTLPVNMDIANETVWAPPGNLTGVITTTLSNNFLSGKFDYNALSNTTTPIRFGFYEGNQTNSTGNITDVFILTSRAGTMGTADIVGTTATRLELAINLSKNFTDIVLANEGNRVGLQMYFSSVNPTSNPQNQELTDDATTLHNKIDAWDIASQGTRQLCKAMDYVEDELLLSNGRKRVALIMTDGDIDKPCGGSGAAKARQDSIDEACDDADVTGIEWYTVAFGQEAVNNPDVTDMLQQIADCSGGQFAMSDNITGLQEIYETFAQEIAQSAVVFTFQRATTATGVESILYDDSYIYMQYTPFVDGPGQYQIPLTFQTPQFTSCTPTVDILPGLEVVDASITSYSGDFWTKYVGVDGSTVFNLSLFTTANFTNLGDPFTVQIPANLLSVGSHTLDIRLGANTSVDESCVLNDSMIYTALVNASTQRTNVLPTAEGCNWFIEFENGNTLNAAVPLSYAGANNCSYNSTLIDYNSNDAYDTATAQLLSQLDFDGDGRLFIDLEEEDLQIYVTLLNQVPYLWGPSISRVEVWR